jgi:DNA-binding GntR family transcriptional regulator
VLARGRLIRSASLATMRAEAGVGSRVRTPDPSALRAALDAAGLVSRWAVDELIVEAPPEEVGELCAKHGIVLHALAGTADLEQAFFRLVEESPEEKVALS